MGKKNKKNNAVKENPALENVADNNDAEVVVAKMSSRASQYALSWANAASTLSVVSKAEISARAFEGLKFQVRHLLPKLCSHSAPTGVRQPFYKSICPFAQ